MPNTQTTESQAPSPSRSRWEAPRVEVISLSCEITAYAPDGEPLF
jgi:coenzyme PQQ precursor peptide PqqA